MGQGGLWTSSQEGLISKTLRPACPGLSLLLQNQFGVGGCWACLVLTLPNVTYPGGSGGC